MKNLHSLAFCALIAPAITLSSGAVLAQSSTDLDDDRRQQGTQTERTDRQSNQGATNADQRSQRTDRSDSMSATERRNQSGTDGNDYMSSAPTSGMQASHLLGANVKTTAGEDVGSVDDLIIDKQGQVVAIKVGVGGFLGMGQKDVAIGWDQVTKSGDSDDLELRVNATRDQLRDAPKFEQRD